MSWHQTIIVGNLGGDPEMKYLQSGTAVCNFSVAVSERWRDKQSNEQREKTTWYRVDVWGAQAETCNTYLAKGAQVMVIGNVTADAYMKNGEAQASLKLTAREVRFLSGGNSGNAQNDNGRMSDYTDNSSPSKEDIPF